MGGPVEQQQSGSGDNFALIFGEPAEISAFVHHAHDPRLEVLGHDVQYLVIAASGIYKHAMAMVGNGGGVGWGGCARLKHT
jgi:hypothetical protein